MCGHSGATCGLRPEWARLVTRLSKKTKSHDLGCGIVSPLTISVEPSLRLFLAFPPKSRSVLAPPRAARILLKAQMYEGERQRVPQRPQEGESTMKNFGISAAFAAVLSVSAVGLAAFSQDVSVTSIEVDAAPGPGAGTTTSTYLSFSTTPNSKTACTDANLSVIDGTAEHVRSVTALLNGAMLAGKKVNVFYNAGCFTAGGTTYSKIANVRVQQ